VRLTTPRKASEPLRNVIKQLNRLLRGMGPSAPRRIFARDLLTELPPAADYPDCVAYARDTGLVVSDGTNWS